MKLSTSNKKGNVAAIVLVLMLVVIAIGVFVYQPFIPEEEAVNYGELLTDVRSAMDRGVQETFQTSLQTGLGAIGRTGTVYWNAAFAIDEDEITQNIEEDIGDHILQLEFEGGTIEITLDELDGSFDVTLEEEGLRVNMQDASVTIEENGETRTVNLEDEYVIPSNLKNTLESVNTWLECDAGGLTDIFEEWHSERDCRFQNCCCMDNRITESELLELMDSHGINDEDVVLMLEESVLLLNNLLHEDVNTCDEAREFTGEIREDYVCGLNLEGSTINTQNNYADLNYSTDMMCSQPTPDCALEPFGEVEGILSDWNNPSIEFDDSQIPEDQAAFEGTGPQVTDPLLGLGEPLQEAGDSPFQDETIFFAVGSEKMAEGQVEIQCSNPDMTVADNEEFKFQMKFKNKYSCQAPPTEYEEIEGEELDDDGLALACKADGSGGGGTITCAETGIGTACPEELVDPALLEAARDEFGACLPENFMCGSMDDDTLECTPSVKLRDDGSFEILGDGEWAFPEANHGDECGACSLCSDEGQCEVPAPENTPCDSDFGTCGGFLCDGSGYGDEACNVVALDDNACGTNQCGGICTYEEGSGVEPYCDFTSDGQSCDYNLQSCTLDEEGVCDGGQCTMNTEGLVCCGNDVCGEDQFCCPDEDDNSASACLTDTQSNREACETVPN